MFREKHRFFRLKTLLFCFMQKRLKLFILSALVLSCFLFFHSGTFAISFATYYAEKVGYLEEHIKGIFNLNDEETRKTEQQYIIWLSNLHSQNDTEFKKALKGLFLDISRKAPPPGCSTELYYSTIRELATIQTEINAAPVIKLQAELTRFFQRYFGENFVSIEFLEKRGGIQLGLKARITLRNSPNKIDYYVKTHRGGLLSPTMSSGSAAQKPVDLKELFVYKVFELIGLTPETHLFFGENANDFYMKLSNFA